MDKLFKVCKDCKERKPRTDFQKSGKYELARCKICHPIYSRAKSAVYLSKNREAHSARMKKTYHKHKQLVFLNYGNICSCCGENEALFLTIDHINNDGHLHRKNMNSTSHHNIYGWLVRNNFPEGFQILCMNCNTGKHRNNGVCPHKSRKFNDHPEREYTQVSGSGTNP